MQMFRKPAVADLRQNRTESNARGGHLSLFNGSMQGIEHSYATGVELQDQSLSRVQTDASAHKAPAVINKGKMMAESDAQLPPLFYKGG